ncbi:kelch repeat protein [Colletotrichum orchidophilum]|uniref:Kelch repeat protein n=1 Tax=Colletotrichum orchidophilum TaxID=1209926 RepID=A0A1G4BEX2_9PEZI|nr:kelch repeat protein [Colletotrichum orchidophilum]OHE99994.1 kelch repeat protein [Colletotrichum orchidophilum]
MDRQALWKREDTKSFYIWGGHNIDSGRLMDESLSDGSWKFQTDGTGGGQWSKETATNPTEFEELERSEDGAFASTPQGGFWFGGMANFRTRLNATNGNTNTAVQPIPGMVFYDWKTNQWSNETEEFKAAFPPFGTVRGARALFVPNYGSNGIILLMGGFQSTLEPIVKASQSLYKWMDFSNITFMDPVSRKWYSQKTTGSAPTKRQWFCMVGVEGKSSYEM